MEDFILLYMSHIFYDIPECLHVYYYYACVVILSCYFCLLLIVGHLCTLYMKSVLSIKPVFFSRMLRYYIHTYILTYIFICSNNKTFKQDMKTRGELDGKVH